MALGKPLKNPKHEKFAELVASGIPVADAHEKAGFKRNDGNARRLRCVEAVAKRIEALQTAVAERVVKANTAVAIRGAYDRETAMTEAKHAYDLAMSNGQASAAIAAVTLRAKLNNLLIERREVTFPPIKDMPTAQIKQLLIELDESDFTELPSS
jgi:hypothetical protein